jgi:hypothetical protein
VVEEVAPVELFTSVQGNVELSDREGFKGAERVNQPISPEG